MVKMKSIIVSNDDLNENYFPLGSINYFAIKFLPSQVNLPQIVS